MAKPLLVWREPKLTKRQSVMVRIAKMSRLEKTACLLALLSAAFLIFVLHNTAQAFIFCAAVLGPILLRRVRPTYLFEENGICYESGTTRKRLRWDEIERCVFMQMESNGLHRLSFHCNNARRNFSMPQFVLDEKIEARVLTVLREKLPGKEIVRLTTRPPFELEVLS